MLTCHCYGKMLIVKIITFGIVQETKSDLVTDFIVLSYN